MTFRSGTGIITLKKYWIVSFGILASLTSYHKREPLRMLDFFRARSGFCLLSIICIVFSDFFFYRLGFPVVPINTPAERAVEAANSLLNSGTLQAPEYHMLKDKILNDAKETGKSFFQDVFALGTNNELYPKHSLVPIFGAVLGVAIAGDYGPLLIQNIFAFLLFLSIWSIINNVAPPKGISILLMLMFGTQLFFSLTCYVYTYDLHGLTFLFGGLALAKCHPVLGGFVAGLSVLVRPTYILYLPMIPAFWSMNHRKIFTTILGIVSAILLFFTINTILFGSPYTTSYHRAPIITPDGLSFAVTHPIGLNFDILFSDITVKLFDKQKGLITYNLLYLLVPWCLVGFIKKPTFKSGILLTEIVIPIIYFFSYEMWNSTSMGNRFLLPSTICCVLLFFFEATKYRPFSSFFYGDGNSTD